MTVIVCYNGAMEKQNALRLSIQELAARTGVSIRTIRYYLAAGLLPSPGARGKSAHYGEEHLLRLELVRRLVDQRVPLAEIRERLEALSVPDLRGLLAEEEARQQRLAEANRAGRTREYVAGLLERGSSTLPAASLRRRLLFDSSPDVALLRPAAAPGRPPAPIEAPSDDDWLRWRVAPGIELSVKREIVARHRPLIEQLLRVARAMVTDLDLGHPPDRP
jgi:DNA-binding transcriptional MerR regulator